MAARGAGGGGGGKEPTGGGAEIRFGMMQAAFMGLYSFE
jgi:hypothetical protein